MMMIKQRELYKENKNREEGAVLPEEFEESVWLILAGNAGCFTVDAEAPEMGQSSDEAKRMDKLRPETRCENRSCLRCCKCDERIECASMAM